MARRRKHKQDDEDTLPTVLFKIFVLIPVIVGASIWFYQWYFQPARWQITNNDIKRMQMKP